MIDRIKNKYLRRTVLILILPLFPFLSVAAALEESYKIIAEMSIDMIESFMKAWNRK